AATLPKTSRPARTSARSSWNQHQPPSSFSTMGARSASAPVCTAAGDRIGSRAASDAAIAEARVARNAEWDAARGIWSLYDVEAASESSSPSAIRWLSGSFESPTYGCTGADKLAAGCHGALGRVWP